MRVWCTRMHGGGTQSMVLSAAVANPGAPDPHSGPNCIVLPAPRTGPGLQLLAEWYQRLARAPPVESCAQPATVIESYLYPSRTGRVTAQIGHTRAHGDHTVKMNVHDYLSTNT